jgi:Mn-dependent DtxR family transcriptional regulator
MRYSGRWMSLADDRILEYIRENKSGTATEMVNSGYVRYSKPYVTQRCKELVNHNLLKHLGNGVYVITEDGERYLDGELDTAEEENDDSEREATAD